ncbi:hypothetical protein DFQ26_000664 [Actinomortierella ambigua]|nr:hypothetical protein DFQ26_000664 [Actinomortierella ambigua]
MIGAAFRTLTTNRFGNPNSSSHARFKMHRLTQKTTVAEYVEEFEGLATRLADLSEPKAKSHLLAGLRQNLNLRFAGSSNLNQLSLSEIKRIADNMDKTFLLNTPGSKETNRFTT